ncbi:hypothetical protein D9M72_624010 [compost metagenome]
MKGKFIEGIGQYPLGDRRAKPLAEAFRIENADGEARTPIDVIEIVEPHFAGEAVLIDDPGRRVSGNPRNPGGCLSVTEEAGKGPARTEHSVDFRMAAEPQARIHITVAGAAKDETDTLKIRRRIR